MRGWRNLGVFSEMEAMRREMNEIMRRMGYGYGQRMMGGASADMPRINLSQDADNLYLYAQLPGIKAEDLEMNILKNTLTLSGSRRIDEGENNQVYHRKERGIDKFMRTIELPFEVDTNRAEAELKNGCLKVMLPKAEEAKPHKLVLKP